MAPHREGRPLPPEFLAWQVTLRLGRWSEQHGAPHAGVAPLVVVRPPGVALGASVHSIICGLLPRPDAARREDARSSASSTRPASPRAPRRLRPRHRVPEATTTPTPSPSTPAQHHDAAAPKLPLVDALRAESRCALVFYVFDLRDRSEVGRFRCLHLDCRAEVLERGPVYDNVWWHNTLFHGPADDHVVVHFRHEASWDTRFGRFDRVAV